VYIHAKGTERTVTQSIRLLLLTQTRRFRRSQNTNKSAPPTTVGGPQTILLKRAKVNIFLRTHVSIHIHKAEMFHKAEIYLWLWFVVSTNFIYLLFFGSQKPLDFD
jgi:hypothetical protein